MACGIGIYQAYLPFAMGVLLIYGMLRLAEGTCSGGKEILRTAGRMAMIAAAALALYLAVNAAVLSAAQAQMSDYRSWTALAGRMPPVISHALRMRTGCFLFRTRKRPITCIRCG